MYFKTTASRGRIAKGSTPYGDYLVEWDWQGRLIRESCTPREPIPADHDPSTVKRSGCCDPPQPN